MKNSLMDFENIGIGKPVLCVGNGFSFEENIAAIQKNQSKVDIMCCDKTLGALLEHGIVPTYCVVADANVPYSYLEPYKDRLTGTILIMNVCANPEWAQNGNWKKKYFIVNKDVLESEKEFLAITKCPNIILAATNVSNCMIVLLTQSTDHLPRNFFGYDKILLIGYDYSWKFRGKYYAFDETGGGRAQYMRHMYIHTPAGTPAYTSGNLWFSMQWLQKYIATFRLPIIQCAPDSLLQFGPTRDLSAQMDYTYKPENSYKIRKAVSRLRTLMAERAELENLISGIGNEHQKAFLQSI